MNTGLWGSIVLRYCHDRERASNLLISGYRAVGALESGTIDGYNIPGKSHCECANLRFVLPAGLA